LFRIIERRNNLTTDKEHQIDETVYHVEINRLP